MKPLNISLIQLEYLVALDNHRHFVKAADTCNVTQPTLSMQIKKLEEELNLKLFDRSHHPVIPTDVGVLIIDQARKILNETRKIDDILLDYRGEVTGELVIGIIPTVSPYLMPFLISQISRKYSQLRLKVKEMFTEEIVNALARDLLDVGIVATPLHTEGLVEKPIFYERFRLYLNPNHPAYGKNKLEPSDLMLDKLWLLNEGNCFRNQAINLCEMVIGENKHISFDYESGSLETLKRIVDLEGGATVLPEWASELMCSGTQQHIRTFTDDTAVREISVVYTRNYAKARLITLLEDMIKLSVPAKLLENKNLKVAEVRP
jgi:LysR family hydrogen peroxide-inducible transcriptional activator